MACRCRWVLPRRTTPSRIPRIAATCTRTFLASSRIREGRHTARKAPLPKAYGDEPEQPESQVRVVELHDPTASPETRRFAAQSWDKIIPSKMDPAKRTTILRRMRELDWPAHASKWGSGSAEDDAHLYRWIDEAMGQAFYQKGLWVPPDWTEEDASDEEGLREDMKGLLEQEMATQLQKPYRERYGDAVVDEAIKVEPDFTKLPELIWESPESGEMEWMAEHTADVVLPYLVRLETEKDLEGPRRFWERQARNWAKRMGGAARGLNGMEPLPYGDEESGTDEPTEALSTEALSTGSLSDERLELLGGAPRRGPRR